MPICEGCGFSFEDKFQFCPNCGRSKLKGIDTKISTQEKNGFACPICESPDKVEKVSAIINAQTRKLDGSVPVVRSYTDRDGNVISGTVREGFSGTDATVLAKYLTFNPVKPSVPEVLKSWSAIIFWIIGIAALFLGWLIYSPGQDISGPICTGSSFILLAILATITISRQNKKAKDTEYIQKIQAERDSINRAIGKWERLYYCHRDGCVFIPGESGSAPVENMKTFLYQ